jgi:hypothetical protein
VITPCASCEIVSINANVVFVVADGEDTGFYIFLASIIPNPANVVGLVPVVT